MYVCMCTRGLGETLEVHKEVLWLLDLRTVQAAWGFNYVFGSSRHTCV